MGLYTPIYSENGPSIEFAVLELLDLVAQRATDPGVDDVMDAHFMRDRGDGVGERVRPTTTVTLRCKTAQISKTGEQQLDQTGSDPDSLMQLTLYEEDLLELGLVVNGVVKLTANDRLLRLLNSDGIMAPDGTVRVDFAANGRVGLRCLEVREGVTGTRVYTLIFESQRSSALGLGL